MLRRGLADTRQGAQRLIASGSVLVSGAVALREARLVAPHEPVEVMGPPSRFVGRGGEKLDAALDHFDVKVGGVTALDAGASTGGFVDCLLQRGARSVVALDVGHGQLDPRLRGDPRVLVMEKVNIRHVTTQTLELAGVAAAIDVVTADLAFISLTAVVPTLIEHVVRPGGDLVLLVKPQFEVGRAEASRGKGVVRDPESWFAALRTVASSLELSGAAIIDVMRSPIRGASGNVEFFVHAIAPVPPSEPSTVLPSPLDPRSTNARGRDSSGLLRGVVF